MTGGADRLRIRFRGVRGSFPVPGPSTAAFGGNTPCIEVRAGDRLVILDAGTGLVHLGEEISGAGAEMTVPHLSGRPLTLALFFSHLHHDHVQGFPFFKPSFQEPSTFHLFGPRSGESFRATFDVLMQDPYFPAYDVMRARRVYRDMEGGDAVIWTDGGPHPEFVPAGGAGAGGGDSDPDSALRVEAHWNPGHPSGGVLNFRIAWRGRSFVYATDTEGRPGGDPDLARFARGSDLLIHDAQYTDAEYDHPDRPTRGWGHSTFAMAIDTARLAGIERLVLFHHDPFRDDEGVAALERAAKALLPGSLAAREGMELEV